MSFPQAMAVFVNAFVRDMCVIVNVGPDATGTVPSKQAAVLRQVGGFLSANSEALYSTRGGPWNPVEGQYGFTFTNQTVYAHLLAGYSVYTTTSGSGGSGGGGGGGGGMENISGLSGSGRYVRMYGTARATQWSYSLYSLEVFSS
ncbi:hypothetical protein P3T37_006988 [Kitasatospora sp. MAA4]|uniref:hypothetical protein n=1 Tax=Kitasatospora sp. MAA4 TaxID=3035093 RepID=UPI0024739678|nr:hypothetical protein [Kitasatospora sp. MAA4]MDH6137555.1 hypothetical protein [Kitasatospora sp. MAA4]